MRPVWGALMTVAALVACSGSSGGPSGGSSGGKSSGGSDSGSSSDGGTGCDVNGHHLSVGQSYCCGDDFAPSSAGDTCICTLGGMESSALYCTSDGG
jgi:hypothetical protein